MSLSQKKERLCVSVFFKCPSHSCQEGLLKYVILNKCLGAPAIITTVMTAVSQKGICLLVRPEAGPSPSHQRSADIEMLHDIDYSIRNLILQVGGWGGCIKCQSWMVEQEGRGGDLGLVINNRE